MTEIFGLPEQDAELAMAVQVLTSKTGLEYAVLDALVGEPHTYTALKPLLDGRRDEALSRVVKKLREWGAVDQRLDFDSRSKEYRLTALGKLVWARIQQMRPSHEGAMAYERGLAAQ